MKIYTRTGDQGETGLFGGGRVSKAHVRVEAYGAVDEMNALLGWAATRLGDAPVERLRAVQADLFAIGAHLATPGAGDRKRPALPPLPAGVEALEAWIDEMDADLPELRSFILPGGSPAAAALHVARTVCRRAERAVVALAAADPVEPGILVYLNRLSDLLFTLAREANRVAGVADVEWSGNRA
ncbi:MAG TPA: cob(I)yrinic acid a,c-diamide adenosyltransferase [Longimicrobiales bacterium]|nr:cob(I)yrinic acid a,c-diamide adenosyltransferase [Longimicrobiales bacterium]